MPKQPPTRKSRFPGEFLISFQQHPIELLRSAAATYGDVVQLRGDLDSVLLVAHPDGIRDILVTQARNFKKGRALENARRFLGDGLLTSEGDFHRSQRRMMQPAFHRRRIERYAQAVNRGAALACQAWRDGARVDIMDEMMSITMPIVAETLFGASMQEHVSDVSSALSSIVGMFRLNMLPFAPLLEKLPLPAITRLRRAERLLHDITSKMITERRRSLSQGDEARDLLALLIAAQDPGEDSDFSANPAQQTSRSMTDQQIHDEVLTLFIAGHETTSVWLTWTWYLLSRHPTVETALHEEIDRVLAGAPIGYEDIPRLSYLRRVLLESLRLYPPAWAIGRRCLTDTEVSGYEVKAETIIVVAPTVTHVDPRFWTDPLLFNPDRWADEAAEASRPKFAFFPFGGGPRTCIGEQFAWMEATILLATLAQQWQPRLAPGAVVATKPAITLRPKHGLPMVLERRIDAPKPPAHFPA